MIRHAVRNKFKYANQVEAANAEYSDLRSGRTFTKR